MGSTLRLSELGNEPDFYPGYPSYNRPPNWTMTEYIREWNWKSGVVARAMGEKCPGGDVGFVAPSFIWSNWSGRAPWDPQDVFAIELDTRYMQEIAMHK